MSLYVRKPVWPAAPKQAAAPSKALTIQRAAVRVPPVYRPTVAMPVQAKTAMRSPPGVAGMQPVAPSIRIQRPVALGAFGIARTLQRASEVKTAPTVAAEGLNAMATKIHGKAGGSTQNTTAVAKLKNGDYVVATQLTLATIQSAAAEIYGIASDKVQKSATAGVHMEVALYRAYGATLVAVGASQGFCPYCREFLNAKAISMEGAERATPCQVWKSPEFMEGKEKAVLTAAYPWYFFKDEVEGKRMRFDTKAEFDLWYAGRMAT